MSDTTRRTYLEAIGALGVAAVAGCTGQTGSGDETPPGEGALAIEIAEGTVDPGETVTLQVTNDSDPVEDATVRIDYQEVGTTDTDGRLTVTLPREPDVAMDVEKGEREGEREFEFDITPSEGETLGIEVVEGSIEPGETVTVAVSADGGPIAGATIEVNGDQVGTTDSDGRIELTVPENTDGVTIEADTSDRSSELTVSFEDD